MTDVDAEVWFVPSAKGPQLYTRSGGDRTWIELDDLPHGQTISSVVLRTVGNGTAPATISPVAKYTVVRWKNEDDFVAMSAQTDDTHTVGNWGTVTAQTITITSLATIDRAYRYAVQIEHHVADNGNAMITWGATASGTASSLVV
jgi:hypothetical protein